MSRIDEIKARIMDNIVEYHDPETGYVSAEPDMLWLLDRIAKLEAVSFYAKELLWGRYGGVNNDEFVTEIALDRARGKSPREVALYDALAALDNDDAEKEFPNA